MQRATLVAAGASQRVGRSEKPRWLAPAAMTDGSRRDLICRALSVERWTLSVAFIGAIRLTPLPQLHGSLPGVVHPRGGGGQGDGPPKEPEQSTRRGGTNGSDQIGAQQGGHHQCELSGGAEFAGQ